jgi:hypothetical protein
MPTLITITINQETLLQQGAASSSFCFSALLQQQHGLQQQHAKAIQPKFLLLNYFFTKK